MFIVGVASMVGFVLSFEQVPMKLAKAMLAISTDKTVLLLLINVVLLVLGLFLEPISIMILTMPVLLTLVKTLGIDLVHFGMIVTLNTVIGLVHPPVGICLFIVSGISGVKLEELTVDTLPMIGICIAILMLITYVPELSLWLPSLFETTG
jgi:TRAP-type C4-dicarboxylate transport system permease large subunit